MRAFCLSCHRPAVACFCAQAVPFATDARFALVVHPYEARSTIGTAWIMRRSITNLTWIRSKGHELDTNPHFLEALCATDTVPLLLFPGASALNMNQAFREEWRAIVPPEKKPLFIVVDGTWTQAHAILRRSVLLRMLPRVSFETVKLSEYQFKNQPHPACLSSVEGVHRVMEVLAERGWYDLPKNREHDQMIEIFRGMVRFQMKQERSPRFERKLRRGRGFKAEIPLNSPAQSFAPADTDLG